MQHSSLLRIATAFVAIFGIVPTSALAAWQIDGASVIVEVAAQENPTLAPDGAGGGIVAWRDSRDGTTSDIYAQRVDTSGALLWPGNGMPVCVTNGTQSSPDIHPDGANGAIVAWRDDRNGTGDVYAQRVGPAGQSLWAGNGIPLASSLGNETFPTIISDLSPGTVTLPGTIVGYFERPLGQPAILRVQHVDISGAALWTPANTGGVVVTASIGQKFVFSIASDGVGAIQVAKGAVLVWEEIRPGVTQEDVYASRVSSAGVLQWGPEGTIVCGLSSRQKNPVIANVGSDKTIVVWEDTRNTITDLFAQKLNANGIRQWAADGVPIVTTAGSDASARIVADGADGALVFWKRGSRVYGQRVNSNGQLQWDADGVPLASVDGAVDLGEVVPDGNGGAIVSWIDSRGGSNDVYAQRVDGSGTLVWNAAGAAFCAAALEQATPVVSSDGSSGAIVAWRDSRSGDADIYANRVTGGGGVVDAAIASWKDAGAAGARFSFASANPTRGGTQFVVTMSRADNVLMDVLDVAGRRVDAISPSGPLAAGAHRLAWDGRNATGTPVAPGTYFIRMTAGDHAQTERVVVLK